MYNNDNILGERIAYILVREGKTQTELCESIEMKTSTLSAIITGERKNPRIETIISIAKGLNVSLDYLMGLTGEPSTNVGIKAISDTYGISSIALKNIQEAKDSYEMLSYDDLNNHLSFSEIINTLLESNVFFSFIVDFLYYIDYHPSINDKVQLRSERKNIESLIMSADILEDYYFKNVMDDIKEVKRQSHIHLKALKTESSELRAESNITGDYTRMIELSESMKKIESEIKSLEELRKEKERIARGETQQPLF